MGAKRPKSLVKYKRIVFIKNVHNDIYHFFKQRDDRSFID